jgi:hypothetical protein
MFWNLVLAEQQRLFRRPLVLVEGGILALLVLGMSVALYAINARMPESPMPAPVWSDTTTTMLQIACTSLVGGVLVVVLVGAVTAQAYQWRTIHLWVSHGAPRGTLPDARALLYEECIDILLLRWRQQQGEDLLTRLELPQFRTSDLLALMARLGFAAHEQSARTEQDESRPADLEERDIMALYPFMTISYCGLLLLR